MATVKPAEKPIGLMAAGEDVVSAIFAWPGFPLFPEVGAGLGHNPAVLDEHTPPGQDPAPVEIIVPDDAKRGFVAALNMAAGNLLRLDVPVQLLLAIFKPGGQVGGPLRAPEEVEIIPEPLVLVQFRDRSKESVIAFKSNGCFLHDAGRLGIGRGLGAGPIFADLLLDAVRPLLGHEKQFVFPKLNIGVECNGQRAEGRDQAGLGLFGGKGAGREREEEEKGNR